MRYALRNGTGWYLRPLGLSALLLGEVVVVGFVRGTRLGGGMPAVVLVVFGLGPVANGLSRPPQQRRPALMPAAPLERVAAVAVLGAGYEPEPGRVATCWLGAAGLERPVEGGRVLRLATGSRMVVSAWGGGRDLSTAEVAARGRVARG